MNSIDPISEARLKQVEPQNQDSEATHVIAIAETEIVAMQKFIENALESRLQGNPTQFNYLLRHLLVMIPTEQADGRVTEFQKTKDDVMLLVCRKILLALTRCISRITREAEVIQPLFDTLFKFSFYTSYEGENPSASMETIANISAYTSFLLNLVSSQSVFAIPTLHMLVRNLARPKDSDSTDMDAFISSRSEYVHEALQRVLTIIPTSANVLISILSKSFPHKRMAAIVQVTYVRHLMKVADYAPALKEQIIALTVDRLVQIDVEIKLDEKDMDTAEETMFTMDDFLDENLPTGDVEDIDEMADKLDEMMLVMFEYLGQPSAQVGDSDSVTYEAAHIFKCLLRAFELSILNTHRSKYPQFLLFYVCQYHSKFQNAFISHLITACIDPKIPAVTRQNYGAYLASFLARAKYVSATYLEKALYHLLRYLHDQLDVYEQSHQSGQASTSVVEKVGNDRAADDRPSASLFHKAIFISTLQTVCYVVCFRGLEMVNAPRGYDFLRSLGWERLFDTISPCPLVFCQQSVALEFLNVAELFQLISPECAERVDQSISSFGSSVPKYSAGRDSLQSSSHTICNLNWTLSHTFFPFDPYLLRRSFKFIGPLYLYWKHADPTSEENATNLEHTKRIIEEFEDESNGDGETTDGEIDVSSVESEDECGDKDHELSVEMQEESLFDGAQQYIDSMDISEFDDATCMLAAKQMQRKRGQAMFSQFFVETVPLDIVDPTLQDEAADFIPDEEMEGF